MFLGNSLPVFYDFPLEKHSGDDWEGNTPFSLLGGVGARLERHVLFILVWHGGF